MIEIKHLTKSFDDITPFKDVSLTINDGDVISIIGPSGTGKSTFLRCLNLLNTPTEGQILVDGVEITHKKYKKDLIRKKMGMVFQNFNLFPHLTILENVMRPQIDVLKRDKQESYEKALALLKKVGLANKANAFPDELSGGQKQRIAIARALAMDPEIILFDEPTSALDPSMVGEVESVIKSLAGTGKTMLIVTHEMRFAKEISNRVLFMDKQTLLEDGTPEQIFEHPIHTETRRFVRRIKYKEFYINNKDDDLLSLGNNIDNFVAEQYLSAQVKAKIQALYSILVCDTLFPILDKIGPIYFSMEHNQDQKKATICISYKGEEFNPFLNKEDQKLNRALHIVDKHKFEYIKEEGNSLRFTIFY